MRYRQNTKGDILYGPPVSVLRFGLQFELESLAAKMMKLRDISHNDSKLRLRCRR